MRPDERNTNDPGVATGISAPIRAFVAPGELLGARLGDLAERGQAGRRSSGRASRGRRSRCGSLARRRGASTAAPTPRAAAGARSRAPGPTRSAARSAQNRPRGGRRAPPSSRSCRGRPRAASPPRRAGGPDRSRGASSGCCGSPDAGGGRARSTGRSPRPHGICPPARSIHVSLVSTNHTIAASAWTSVHGPIRRIGLLRQRDELLRRGVRAGCTPRASCSRRSRARSRSRRSSGSRRRPVRRRGRSRA